MHRLWSRQEGSHHRRGGWSGVAKMACRHVVRWWVEWPPASIVGGIKCTECDRLTSCEAWIRHNEHNHTNTSTFAAKDMDETNEQAVRHCLNQKIRHCLIASLASQLLCKVIGSCKAFHRAEVNVIRFLSPRCSICTKLMHWGSPVLTGIAPVTCQVLHALHGPNGQVREYAADKHRSLYIILKREYTATFCFSRQNCFHQWPGFTVLPSAEGSCWPSDPSHRSLGLSPAWCLRMWVCWWWWWWWWWECFSSSGRLPPVGACLLQQIGHLSNSQEQFLCCTSASL